MQGRKKSLPCEKCDHHPTRRVYIKCNGILKGMAWLCPTCDHFTMDDDAARFFK